MAGWLSREGYAQICVARGIVSWGSEVTMQQESFNFGIMRGITITALYTLHFQKCTDKMKTLLTKKSKFHFLQYWKQIVPCESTDKGVSSRGSRVRTKFYGSIIDSGSDRVLTMYSLTIIYTEPFLFKKLAYLCVYAVTLMYLL